MNSGRKGKVREEYAYLGGAYPLVRQRLSNFTGLLYRQPRQHILEIGIRIMPIHAR